ncbi:MAG: serine/threonine protein kinase [Proteobacteria bacterium]|nr:serine/threonine protein kinase [Pseudomonadota bacterium]
MPISENFGIYIDGAVIDDRYRIVSKLGVGGMGQVYEVEDLKLNNERIALKILSPIASDNNENIIERFRNEVLISRRLTHPNIVRTFDYGQLNDGRLYMTMESIKGDNLEVLIHKTFGEKASSFDFLVLMIKKIAHGLAYAHKQGVTHRDLKTANILVSNGGEIKITDFGLAQMRNVNKKLTVTGECVGTPYYMSPEQVMGRGVDQRSDVYALGIIAFELAMGKVPFHDESWYNLAKKIINEPIPQVISEVIKIPDWYDLMVCKCVEKNPDERFQSVQELIKFIDENIELDLEPTKREETMSAQTEPLVIKGVGFNGNRSSGSRYHSDKSSTLTIALTVAIIVFSVIFLAIILMQSKHLFVKTSENRKVEKPEVKQVTPFRLAPAQGGKSTNIDVSKPIDEQRQKQEADNAQLEEAKRMLQKKMIFLQTK